MVTFVGSLNSQISNKLCNFTNMALMTNSIYPTFVFWLNSRKGKSIHKAGLTHNITLNLRY